MRSDGFRRRLGCLRRFWYILPLCLSWVGSVGATDFSPLRVELAEYRQHCLGAAVAGTGDLDGDGRPDFLVGAPGGYDDLGTRTDIGGSVRAVSGGTGRTIYSVLGGGLEDFFGSCVTSIQDITADGVADFLVGAPGASVGGVVGSGEVFAFSGADGGPIYSIPGQTGSSFGTSIATLADLDGDGAPDFAVGAVRYSDGMSPGPGAVQVFSGLTGSLLRTIVDRKPNESFGMAVVDGGDPDGNGSHDLIVGAPILSFAGPSRGSVYIFDPATGACTDSLSPPGDWPDFGATVALIGDVDADGVPDLAVGAPGALNEGAVAIYSGRTHALLREGAGTFFSSFGAAITKVDDFDGDSIPEYLIGAPTASDVLIEAGSAYLFSGASGSALRTFTGASRGAHLGAACAALGDLNGDARPDFALGAPGVRPYPGTTFLGSAVAIGLTEVREGTAFASRGSTDLRLAAVERACLYLQPAGGSFSADDVVAGTLLVRLGNGGERAVVPADVGYDTDANGDGIPEVSACFGIDALRRAFGWDGSQPDTATVFVEADLTDGSRARAAQLFHLIGLDLRAISVAPNPIGGQGTLTFRTSRVGAVTVDLIDVRGRRVASLFSSSVAAAGVHDVRIGTRVSNGAHLAAGVYFVRIASVDGLRYQKVVIIAQ